MTHTTVKQEIVRMIREGSIKIPTRPPQELIDELLAYRWTPIPDKPRERYPHISMDFNKR